MKGGGWEQSRYDSIKAGWDARRGFSDEDVLARMAAGETRQQVADALGCSAKTAGAIANRYRAPINRVIKETVWSDDAVATLRSEWAAGTSTSAIGRKLNISKSAVCGKADRLDLPARPHMAKNIKPEDRPEVLKRARPKKRLSLLHSEVRDQKIGPQMPAELPPLPPPPVDVVAPKPVIVAPRPKPTAKIVPFRPVRECTFVGGDGKPWIYCDRNAAPGSNFCAEHRQVCIERRRA